MYIAYYLHLNYSHNSGIYRKVCEQVKSWCRAGNEVRLFVVTCRLDARSIQEDLGDIIVNCERYSIGNSLSAISSRLSAVRRICARILESRPQIVYTRQDLFYPGVMSLFANLPTVLEVNTDDVAEYKVTSLARFTWNALTRQMLLRRAAGAVFVTNELRSRSHFNLVSDRATVIANGYDILGVTEASPPSADKTHLVFLGSAGMPWHGVDKLSSLAETRPEWQIDLVGVTDKDFGRPRPNVKVHGNLSKSEFLPLLRRATVGIGTLGLHRKGMNEASALKTREYLAYGLPVILGYNDTDLPGEYDFVCQLENKEDNVRNGVAKIVQFVSSWKGRRIPRESVAHMDNSSKEKARVKFFEETFHRFCKI